MTLTRRQNLSSVAEPQPAPENVQALIKLMGEIADKLPTVRDAEQRLILLKDFRVLLDLVDMVVTRDFPTDPVK
jgi:hypothetical protein